MAPKKIQVIPNGDSLKTKWSRAIRYGDLIFTTAHSAARPDGTMPTTPEEQIRGCFESLKNTLEGGGSGHGHGPALRLLPGPPGGFCPDESDF